MWDSEGVKGVHLCLEDFLNECMGSIVGAVMKTSNEGKSCIMFKQSGTFLAGLL